MFLGNKYRFILFFGDYDELEAVLRESFSLWEDFKREFLAEYPKPM